MTLRILALLAAGCDALRMAPHAPAFRVRAPVAKMMALPTEVVESYVAESTAADATQMALVDKLWEKLKRLYKSEDAALQAVRQNSQVLMPIYVTPELLQESYDGLLSAMGSEADALDIMSQNPAVLTCGAAIATETPDEIRKFAKIRKVLDSIPPEGIVAFGAIAIALIIYRIASVKLGYATV